MFSKDRGHLFSLRTEAFLLDWIFTSPLVFLTVGKVISGISYPPEKLGNAEGLAFFLLIQLIMPHSAALMAVGPYLEMVISGEPVDFLTHVTLILFLCGIIVRAAAVSMVEIFRKGQSLGKKSAGLTMKSLPWYGYFFRNISKEISFHFLFCVPFLVSLFRSDGKTGYDLIFHTHVNILKKQNISGK